MTTKMNFIGLDTQYPTADGSKLVRLHLDGAASPLASKVALDTIQKLLPHYSNSHSYVHSSAQISTKALNWAHQTVVKLLGGDTKQHTAIFTGSGSTAAINRLARGLAAARANKKVVLVSAMEHHANDLPHRQFGNTVVYIPLTGQGKSMGAIDVHEFENLCQQHAENLNYVAFSSVSNVSGIRNSVRELTRIAHKYGALVLIDGAQSVAHEATDLVADNVDFFVFSGHKIYTPMAPGVLVAKRSSLSALSGQDLGGGSVSSVSFYDYQLLKEYPEKEQSGTPNIVGAIALASVLQALSDYGYQQINQHAKALMSLLLSELSQIDGIRIYADKSAQRIGALAINHKGIDHGLFAAILNDYFAIAVRNECFCAHPYVSSLLKDELWELDLSEIAEVEQEAYINRKRGMVRVSLSLYNTENDIHRLIDAVKIITADIDKYRPHYTALADGSYQHQSFSIDWRTELKLPYIE